MAKRYARATVGGSLFAIVAGGPALPRRVGGARAGRRIVTRRASATVIGAPLHTNSGDTAGALAEARL